MEIVYNRIIQSDQEPSPNVLWLKDGILKYYQGGWKDIGGKVQQLENDSSMPYPIYTETIKIEGTSADTANSILQVVEIMPENKGAIVVDAVAKTTDNSIYIVDITGNTIINVNVNKYSSLQTYQGESSKIKVEYEKLSDGRYELKYTDWNIEDTIIVNYPIGYIMGGNYKQISPSVAVGGGTTTSVYGEFKVTIYQYEN